ncbi:MAG: hypothetical protein C4292_04325, partial [Nitrososphaera sp.]
CGIRVLADGCGGFSSTSSAAGLQESLDSAVSMAKVLAGAKKQKVKGLAESKMVRGRFEAPVRRSTADVDIEQKVRVAKEADAAARRFSKMIKTASATYRDMLDRKLIVNSDGAEVEILDSKPEFSVVAIAREGGQSVTANEGIGITGGWDDLFGKKSHLDYAAEAAG